jgi:choice-of-anchor A domain-containing protein
VTIGSPVPALPDFQSTFVQPLMDLSQSLAAMSADSYLPTSWPGFPNNAPIQASAGTGLAVFDITTADLANLVSFQVDLNGRDGIVFNVTGASYTGNANYNNAVNVANKVIWNFVDATSLTFNRQWGGTVLAPNAHVTNGTPIEGTLFANSYGGNGELHSRPFTPDLTPPPSPVPGVPVPAPGALALFGFGLAALVGAKRRATA